MSSARVLVVCVGNLCRSPVAERLLQARLDAVRPGAVTVTSAGTRATDGRAMDPLASDQLVRLGGSPSRFVAARLTPEMVLAADLVLTATKDLRTDVLGLSPRAMRRTFTLSELAAICQTATGPRSSLSDLVGWAAARRSPAAGSPDVIDPYGEPLAAHVRVADHLAELVDVLGPALSSAAG